MLHFFRFLVSKTFIINLLIAIILIVGGLAAILYYIDDYTLHGKELKIPNLVNQTQAEVNQILSDNKNFSAQINDSMYIKGKKPGIVLEQIPKAETTVKQGRKIYLTVASSTPIKIAMPDFVDMSLRQATSLMETYGLEVGELIYKSDLCINCILEQTLEGKKLEKGDKIRRGSKIDLVVGQGLGNELTPVPYLIDMTKDMAEDILKSKSLNLGGLLFDESVLTKEDSMNAKVYKQMPFYSANPILRMGTSVDLFLTLDTNRIQHNVNPTDSI